MIGKLIQSALRIIIAWIDGIISNVISLVYNLLTDLSSLILYSDNIIKSIGSRIGLILGVFMLFRIAISLINYMISPDTINDKSKGGAKLLTNVVVSLVLLATVNIIFEQAYNIQMKIVESHIIEKIFFGEGSNTKMDIGYYLYTSFFTPNSKVLGDDCNSLWDLTFNVSPKSGNPKGKKCEEILNKKLDSDEYAAVISAKGDMDMSKVFSNYGLVLSSENGEFVFNYLPIISTIAGIIILLVLLSFSMELAKRAVKLLFLQIIAPIPIVYNVDPGKGKEVFQKWYKACFSTYISVFLRLVAINFAVFMIVLVKGNFSDIFSDNLLLNVFIVIGCLMFAKEVPKLIEDMLGIKADGMSLRPLKKFQEQALFGKQITSLSGAGLAAGAAFAANTIANNGNIFSGLAGAGSAFARGTVGALKGQKFGQVYSGAYKGAITARNNRDIRNRLDVSSKDIILNSWYRKLGMDTIAETQDAEIKIANDFSQSSESNVTISEGEIDKKASEIIISNFVNGKTGRRETGIITDVNNKAFTDANGNLLQYTTLAELREAAHDQNLSPEIRARVESEYQRLRGDIATKLRELSGNSSNVPVNTTSEFSGIDFDVTSIENMKINIDNMLDIYSKNKSMQVFARTTVDEITKGSKVHKNVKEISNSIQNSPEFRKAHKVQEQANREKK